MNEIKINVGGNIVTITLGKLTNVNFVQLEQNDYKAYDKVREAAKKNVNFNNNDGVAVMVLEGFPGEFSLIICIANEWWTLQDNIPVRVDTLNKIQKRVNELLDSRGCL